METLIKSILLNNDYTFDENISGFHLENKSYFFIKSIESDELEVVMNKSSLIYQTWYHEFLSKFNEKSEEPNYATLEKNSSLVILVNSTSIGDLERLQSQILLIEEDQYYVKKYVIVYTPEALAKIRTIVSNEQLQVAINNRTAFQSLLTNGFSQDNEDYILLMQLFIKLPFLALKFSEDEFVSLSEKLGTNLAKDYSVFQQLLSSNEQLQNIDFLSLESESEIDKLLTLLNNDPN